MVIGSRLSIPGIYLLLVVGVNILCGGSILNHSIRLITSLKGDSILSHAEGGCLDERRYFVVADG